MVDKIDPVTQKAIIGNDGKSIKEEKEIVIPAYKVVTVFDVSQTEGRELPTLEVNELTGEVEEYDLFFKALDKSCPVPIRFEAIENGTKGYFSRIKNEIVIKQGMSQTQTIKTAVHERAHQMLHSDQNQGLQSRSSKEVEAESVAYVVCQHYGIDTSDYSFAYIASWSDGKDTPELKKSLDLIRKTASQMISVIDKTLEEISHERTRENERPSVLENLHTKQEQARRADGARSSIEKNSRIMDYQIRSL